MKALLNYSEVDPKALRAMIELEKHVLSLGSPCPVSCLKSSNTFDEDGNANDKIKMDKRSSGFIKELLWCIEAKRRMTD